METPTPTQRPTIGQKLKELRTRRGYSIMQLVKRSGLDRQALYEYEWGQLEPSIANLQRICKALRVSLRHFDRCQIRKDQRNRPPYNKKQQIPQPMTSPTL